MGAGRSRRRVRLPAQPAPQRRLGRAHGAGLGPRGTLGGGRPRAAPARRRLRRRVSRAARAGERETQLTTGPCCMPAPRRAPLPAWRPRRSGLLHHPPGACTARSNARHPSVFQLPPVLTASPERAPVFRTCLHCPAALHCCFHFPPSSSACSLHLLHVMSSARGCITRHAFSAGRNTQTCARGLPA